MRTKIDAGKIATSAGCAMIIASGKGPTGHLNAIDDGALAPPGLRPRARP
jgi:glutamate 5-kinase